MPITGIIFNAQKVVFGGSDLTSGTGNILQNISNVLQGNVIGGLSGIVIDATLSESHISNCEVTNYPIETGEAISDHVQLTPDTYTMEGVISDTPIGFLVLGNAGNFINSILGNFSDEKKGLVGQSRSYEMYYALRKLQDSRQPFTVTSSLRRYENMIMTGFTVDRTPDQGNEINFKATLQQVNLVSSQSIQGGSQNLAHSVAKKAQSHQDQGQQVTQDQTPSAPGATPLLNLWHEITSAF